MRSALMILFLSLLVVKLNAQDSTFHMTAGITVKKFAGFYFMNGMSAEFTHPKIGGERLILGSNITSSAFGSAFRNKGIPVLLMEVYARHPFRRGKSLQPFVTFNTGFAMAELGSDKYRNISNKSLLLSPEFGLSYKFSFPVQLHTSLGYNLISGNGVKGAGFIYPLFFQWKILYSIR